MWPLEGIKVLDLTQNVAGPYASMILGEFGAEVTKVEPPKGDPTRAWGPPFWGGYTPTYLSLNRNKTTIMIDMKTKQGLQEVYKKIQEAEVVLVSNRPASLKKLGLDYESVKKHNHRIIYGEVTAFGNEGPKSSEPGYDPLMQAMAGIMSVTGHQGQPPVRVGTSIIDMSTGMWLSIGVLNALLMQTNDNQGRRVTSSLYESAVAWMSYHMAAYWSSGEAPTSWGSGNAMISPYEAFPANDGWVVIAAGNDKLFEQLCEILNKQEWLHEERYKTNALRVENREVLSNEISAITAQHTTEHWLQLLRSKGIPVAPVLDAVAMDKEPQLKASGIVQKIAHPAIDGFKSIGLPLKIDDERPPLRFPPL
ncbi:CaiB/BaiF CoA transferase family protein [Alteribacillus sp. JSM 102045]|uniref:CaiB/BaiF CoA transferase family protein n=1 Tax=Alteribacillus sp. JSM 102045 TaxID=1562101 RepID=UPI0035C24B5C